MSTRWRAARSLLALINEVNAAYPDRPKAADGLIGDQAHAARVSDHNPNAHGVVTAWDITTAPFCDALADKLRQMGARGDGRVKYVIWKRRITSAEHRWRWVPYGGTDPHTGHIHLSVSADPAQYDRTDHWHVFDLTSNAVSQPTLVLEDDMYAVISDPRTGGDYGTNGVSKFPFASQQAKNDWADAFKATRLKLSADAFDAIPTVKAAK